MEHQKYYIADARNPPIFKVPRQPLRGEGSLRQESPARLKFRKTWDGPLVSRATMLAEDKRGAKPHAVKATPVGGAVRERAAQADPRLSQVSHALRGFHLL